MNMEKAVLDYVTTLELGELQTYENMAVAPLFSPVKGGPSYVTMKEALEGGVLLVTEVGEGGSVPELKVRNSGDKPVLLLDGEEVSGAKQNRVLNTTILIVNAGLDCHLFSGIKCPLFDGITRLQPAGR